MGAGALQGRVGRRPGASRSRLPGASRGAQPPRRPGSAGRSDPGDLRLRHLVLPVDPTAAPAKTPAPEPAGAATASAAPQTGAASPGSAAPTTDSGAAAGRIDIKATADCWVQIRAPDQSIVFSRVLKTGETYRVPSRSGLVLRTGNAGALTIAVDGKQVPAIGPLGALRRNVTLDPAALRSEEHTSELQSPMY